MKPFLRNPLRVLTSKWFAVVLIFLVLFCLSILPIANASAQACGATWDITGTSGIKANYQLGEAINGSISFRINNPSDCPGCFLQILVGLVDSQNTVIDVKCIYDGQPKVCPEWTVDTVNVSWEHPSSPGNYRLLATLGSMYSCSDAKPRFRPQESYELLATITVSASKTDEKSVTPTTPALPTPTKEDSTTSSSGSGTTPDGGAPTIGSNTLLIIVAIALLVLLFIFSPRASKARKGFIRFILVLAVVSFIGYLLWMYAIPAITDWFRDNMSTIIGVLLSLGALAIAGTAVWINRENISIWIKEKLGTVGITGTVEIPGNQTGKSDPEEADIEQLCNRIRTRLESMNVPRRHRIEDPYVREVYQWLASEFGYDNVEYEKHGESGRPDLVVDDIIAIEVKGPATNDSLNDLKHKTKYIAPNTKYKRLICVLFEHDYSDSKYDEITQALKILHRNKIFFIQKSSRRGE